MPTVTTKCNNYVTICNKNELCEHNIVIETHKSSCYKIQEVTMFLGMSDWMVALAFLANIAVVIFCIIYGTINYNKGDDCVIAEKEER